MLVSALSRATGAASATPPRGGCGIVRRLVHMCEAHALCMCCVWRACVPRVPLWRNGLKSTAKILFFCDTIKDLPPKHQSQNIFLIILWPYVFF